jgi:polyisoprenoid-binding protein YceI
MQKISIIITTLLVGLFFAFKTSEKAEWMLDKSHAKLGFTVSHLMVSDVEGWFKDFDAKITTDKEDFSDAIVTMTAKVNSINTDNEKRDEDLKSASYFDATKYPTLVFKSKTFKKIDSQNYLVTGDLTIHGVTRTVELNALCKMGTNPMSKKPIAGFKVTGKIKRLDFGVGAGTAEAIIGNDIDIFANVEFSKNQLQVSN